jgi:uncharacterized membrane protein
MKAVIRSLLWLLAILLVSLPACFVATFLLSPFWSWVEATYGIESMGHSGPAEWCFWTIYAIIVVILLFISWLYHRSPRTHPL